MMRVLYRKKMTLPRFALSNIWMKLSQTQFYKRGEEGDRVTKNDSNALTQKAKVHNDRGNIWSVG